MSWKIGIIGTGNVASFWTSNLRRHSAVEIKAKGSNKEKTESFCSLFKIETLSQDSQVDCYLICAQDRNVASIIENLDGDIPTFICAAAYDLKKAKGENFSILYPLQSIEAGNLPSFEEVPFLVENPSDILIEFVKSFNLSYYHVNYQQRIAAHATAVFLNNFSYFINKQGLNYANSQELPLELFKPLIKKTFDNIFIDKDLQTGPAKRNDKETIKTHLGILSGEKKGLYEALTKAISKHYGYEL